MLVSRRDSNLHPQIDCCNKSLLLSFFDIFKKILNKKYRFGHKLNLQQKEKNNLQYKDKNVDLPGFEPTALGTKSKDSTTELRRIYIKMSSN